MIQFDKKSHLLSEVKYYRQFDTYVLKCDTFDEPNAIVGVHVDEVCGDESAQLVGVELVSDGKRGIVDERLEHAHVGEALMVLGHVDEEEQVLEMDASVGQIGEHELELEGARVALVRLVARKSIQLVPLVEQQLVTARVLARRVTRRLWCRRVQPDGDGRCVQASVAMRCRPIQSSALVRLVQQVEQVERRTLEAVR